MILIVLKTAFQRSETMRFYADSRLRSVIMDSMNADLRLSEQGC